MKLIMPENTFQPDPYVVKYDDTYYMYSSSEKGVNIFSSKNKLEWNYLGNKYNRENRKEYWAPCIIKKDETYYLYVSTMPISSDDTHEEAIELAVSDSPSGPFKYVKTLLSPFSIDPHVVKSGDKYYIFYSMNDYESKRAGTLIVVRELINMDEVSDKIKIVVRGTIDEEIFMKDRFKKGQDWHTIEGAFYFRKDNYHYVMYSGNCYQKPEYFLGYAVANDSSYDLVNIDYHKYPDDQTYQPIICKNEFEEGTGHNSVLEENGSYYVFYHGRDLGYDLTKYAELRTARMAKIQVNNDVIKVVER